MHVTLKKKEWHLNFIFNKRRQAWAGFKKAHFLTNPAFPHVASFLSLYFKIGEDWVEIGKLAKK